MLDWLWKCEAQSKQANLKAGYTGRQIYYHLRCSTGSYSHFPTRLDQCNSTLLQSSAQPWRSAPVRAGHPPASANRFDLRCTTHVSLSCPPRERGRGGKGRWEEGVEPESRRTAPAPASAFRTTGPRALYYLFAKSLFPFNMARRAPAQPG